MNSPLVLALNQLMRTHNSTPKLPSASSYRWRTTCDEETFDPWEDYLPSPEETRWFLQDRLVRLWVRCWMRYAAHLNQPAAVDWTHPQVPPEVMSTLVDQHPHNAAYSEKVLHLIDGLETWTGDACQLWIPLSSIEGTETPDLQAAKNPEEGQLVVYWFHITKAVLGEAQDNEGLGFASPFGTLQHDCTHYFPENLV